MTVPKTMGTIHRRDGPGKDETDEGKDREKGRKREWQTGMAMKGTKIEEPELEADGGGKSVGTVRVRRCACEGRTGRIYRGLQKMEGGGTVLVQRSVFPTLAPLSAVSFFFFFINEHVRPDEMEYLYLSAWLDRIRLRSAE